MEKKLTSDEIAFYCTQFAIILNAGLSLHDGVESIADDLTRPREKQLVSKISQVLNDEKPLYMALESTKVFPHYVISMVRVGELTGRLEEVLKGLADYYENESELKSAARSAIIQPLILMVMMFAVVLVMISKVLPVFTDIFRQFDPKIMESLNGVVNSTALVAKVVLAVLVLAILVMVVIVILLKNKKTKKVFEKMFSSCVFTRKIFELYAVSRFTKAMCLMVRSGVDTLEALEFAMDINTNPRFAKKLIKLRQLVADNVSMAEALSEVQMFDGMYNQILKVAYKSGSYEEAWTMVGEKYSERLSKKMEGIVLVIEPVFVGILTIIIGVILVSVMLPLVSVMSKIV